MSSPSQSPTPTTRSYLNESKPGPELPRYRQLPRTSEGVGSGWNLFGENDSVGLMNLQTPSSVAAAAQLARQGKVFPLDLPFGTVDPPLFLRGANRHTVMEKRPGKSLDDVHDNYYPQSGSQWDALAHVAYAPQQFYNDATVGQVLQEGRNTIDHWARRGIVARAILLDVSQAVQANGGAGASTPVTVDDLERARSQAGLEFRPGDVLLVRTGFLTWYQEQSAEERLRQSRPETLTAAGLERSEAMAEYLWDSHACAVASDTAGLECWPPDHGDFPFGFLHQILLGQFGMAIGELWALDDLAADCAADGIYQALLVSAPLHVPGGVGSPANATAIK